VWTLTSHRTRGLRFIREQLARGQPFPSVDQIATQLECRRQVACEVLDGLLVAGHIEVVGRHKTGHRARIWALIP
jgi:DNA-binding transcriptional regulator YhcF (GntR family)